MLRAFLIGLCGAVGVSAAHAADLYAPSIKDDPLPTAITWDGFYAGANGGYSWTETDTTNSFLDTGGSVFGLPPDTLAPRQRFFDTPASGSLDGAFGGFQIGFNRQLSHLVIGIEADIQAGDMEEKTIGVGPLGPTTRTKAEVEYFGTVRGRLGYAIGKSLLYATGGFAYAHAEGTLSITPGFPNAPLGPAFVDKDSGTYFGYAIGGGIEHMLTDSISIKAEYIHLDFGEETFKYTLGIDSRAQADVDLTADIVRGGINFHF